MATKKPENRQKTGKRKANKTSWKPGQSGNEGGRPKATEAQQIAREMKASAQPVVVGYLISVVEDEDADEKDRIAAAKVLIDQDALEMKVDGNVSMKAEVQHGVAEPTAPDGDRLLRIAAVLVRAGALTPGAAGAADSEDDEVHPVAAD